MNICGSTYVTACKAAENSSVISCTYTHTNTRDLGTFAYIIQSTTVRAPRARLRFTVRMTRTNRATGASISKRLYYTYIRAHVCIRTYVRTFVYAHIPAGETDKLISHANTCGKNPSMTSRRSGSADSLF